MKAVCEVVAKRADGGQEIRFYADGVCVKTLHLNTPGQYVVGDEYDVEPDQKQDTRSSPSVSEQDAKD